MSLATLIRFLFGQEAAMREVASNPNAIVVGFLFCLFAGVARHCKDRDLIREPWFLLTPLAASFLSSTLLYAIVFVIARLKPTYRQFLALYWATAPLAVLHLIPVWWPVDDFIVDLVIAMWRAVLIAQVLTVMLLRSLPRAYTIVGLHCLVVLPVWLGSFELPPQSSSSLVMWLTVFIAANAPRLLFGLRAAAELSSVGLQIMDWRSLGYWCIAMVALSIGPLLSTEPKHRLAYLVNQAYKDGRIAEAGSLLLTHSTADFPLRWNPLSGLSDRDLIADPRLPQMLMAIAEGAWDIKEAYRRRVDGAFRNRMPHTNQLYLPFRLEFDGRALVRMGKNPCVNGDFVHTMRLGTANTWVSLVFLGEQDKLCCQFPQSDQSIEITQDRLRPSETTRIQRR